MYDVEEGRGEFRSGEQHHLPGQGQLRPSYLPFFQNDYRVLIIFQINKV